MTRSAPDWTMSSATSINGTEADRLPKSKAGNAAPPDAGDRAWSRDDTLQPWHFFVLLSLIGATAAVVLAREARPEHLVLISLTIGAAGFAGATMYRTLAPLVRKDEVPVSAGLSDSMRGVLEREKMLVLRSIKELEFDRAMGKLSTKDFDEMAGRLRARAMSLMRQLDTNASYGELIERELQARLSSPAARAKRPGSKDVGPASKKVSQPDRVQALAEPASDPGRCACGTQNDADATFCKRCGNKLTGNLGGAQA